MNEETLKALQDSIAHWKRMLGFESHSDFSYKKENPYAEDCPLCKRFATYTECKRDDDEDCPVSMNAGEYFCRNTPWMKASDAFEEVQESPKEHFDFRVKVWRTEARKEIEFLESLLPTNQTKDNE